MIKEFKIKKEIKRMRKSPINGDFLGILRVKLKDYAVSHPVRKEAAGRLLKVGKEKGEGQGCERLGKKSK
ncbi:hypothetical protein HY798_00560 [Candidatus Falkowbacteria bacterium]|nr:hypothetical protein [Candidatus Falkowbacteria bacterium]